ncbi:MAG TPA: TerC/Alx family metal homeostasis membrane protein, partial [Chloroflexota bacterium]
MVLSDFWFLVAFTVVIVGLLVVDLVVINRDMGAPNMRQSALWCAFWVSLALLFSVYVFISRGRTAGLEFLTGYIIEYSLSVDNLFVFFMLFTYFAVPAAYQRRVLFWGILGAFLMRGTMIALGAALIKQFHWILYLFGAFLVFTGFKMLRSGDEEVEPEKNPVVRFARQRLPITPSYVGEKFFVRQGRALLATPLF